MSPEPAVESPRDAPSQPTVDAAEPPNGSAPALGSSQGQTRLFGWVVVCLVLFYFTVQSLYAWRMPLADDEFGGAQAAHRLTELVPYRDFPPYKTVLGTYIQGLPLLLTDNLWAGILLIRSEMAVINSLILLFVAFRLRRHFRAAPICLGLALLVVMSTFLERSFVLRVDMLGSLCGFLSLIFLLERRPGWAGFLAGVGFLISQKSVYFMLAGGAALGSWWLWSMIGERQRRDDRSGRDTSPREALSHLFAFCATSVATLIVYFGFWTLMSSFEKAVLGVARVSVDIGLTDRPWVCPREFWGQTLSRNIGFYLTAGLGLLTLAQSILTRRRLKPGHQEERDWILLTYGAALVGLSVWHKQPCPYFFVILIPTLFVLIVDLFDRLAVPAARWPTAAKASALVLLVSLGLLLPLSRLPNNLKRDNSFQSHNVVLADSLLESGGGYLASLPLLYDRVQPVAEFRWLDDIARRLLEKRSPEELRELVSRMARAELKLIIMNYRMDDLPSPLKAFFADNFAHFWGNVFLYAPSFEPGDQTITLGIGGLYQVAIRDQDGSVALAGEAFDHGGFVRLSRGEHLVSSEDGFRLRFIPEDLDPTLLDPEYRAPRSMFAYSFHY